MAKKKRLIHLAGYGGPYPGSFIPMLRAIMRSAKERGWEPEAVFTPISRERAWLAEFDDDGIPYRFSPQGAHAAGADLVGRRPACRGRRPRGPAHALHGTSTWRPRSPAPDAIDTTVIWHFHTPHFKGPAAFARNVLKCAVFGRRTDQILCVSPGLVETTTKAGAPRGKVEFLHNAVDVDRFPVLTDAQRHAARDEFGLPADRPLLVHFGWDWLRKGGDVFEEALRRLRASDANLAGVTVGGGERRARAGRAPRARRRADRAGADRQGAADVCGSRRVRCPEPRGGHALLGARGGLERNGRGRQRHPGTRHRRRPRPGMRDHPARPGRDGGGHPEAARARSPHRSPPTPWPGTRGYARTSAWASWAEAMVDRYARLAS